MAYLKLRNSKINYPPEKEVFEDRFIVSQIVPSNCSFERPKIIRTVDELEIYYGTKFEGKDYLEELLRMNVALILHRPIQTTVNKSDPSYIDLSKFSNIEAKSLPSKGYLNTIYNLPDNSKWIWLVDDGEGMWMNTELLPQNFFEEEKSESFLNRDRLRILNIFSPNLPQFEIKLDHTYPIGDEFNLDPITFKNEKGRKINFILEWSKNNSDLKGVIKGNQTCAIDVDLSKCSLSDLKGGIIIIPDQSISSVEDVGKLKLIKIGEPSERSRKILSDLTLKSSHNRFNEKYMTVTKIEIEGKSELSIFTELERAISAGYNKVNEIGQTSRKFTIWGFNISNYPPIINIPNAEIKSNARLTNQVIASSIQNNSSSGIEDTTLVDITSRTIGQGDENIKIKIERVHNSLEFKATISRHKYTEEFYGSWANIPGVKLLDGEINAKSKLIKCKVVTRSLNLEGEWELIGARKEEFDHDSYIESLKLLMDFPIQEDFHLVPDIDLFRAPIRSGIVSYYPEYQYIFLPYAKAKNCQVLIQNKDIVDDQGRELSHLDITSLDLLGEVNIEAVKEVANLVKEGEIYDYRGMAIYLDKEKEGDEIKIIWKEHKEDFKCLEIGSNAAMNFTRDPENRLIYFYRNMDVLGHIRPGYYLYLRMILSKEMFISNKDILYFPPNEDPQLSENLIQERLKYFKSNYLSDNGHEYFYSQIFNGSDPETSINTRFHMAKVSRDFYNNRWKLLGNSDYYKEIVRIIDRLRLEYPMIRSLDISELGLANEGSEIVLRLNMTLDEMINENIQLDLNLNYNT